MQTCCQLNDCRKVWVKNLSDFNKILKLLINNSRPESRGMANGIFSWGVYFGYGLAYIYGQYLTKADVLDQGWRSSYVIGGAPGIVIGLLILLTLR